MTVCMLNIGLNVKDAAGNLIHRFSPLGPLGALDLYSVKVFESAVYGSETEPTLVVRCVVPNRNRIALVAEHFSQDCIAVWNVATQEGSLIGPRADKWGAFDPTKFITLTGETLAQVNEE